MGHCKGNIILPSIKRIEEIQKEYNSPEVKKRIEEIRIQSDKLRKQFNSPEWEAQIAAYKKLQNSPEYKKLKEKSEKINKEIADLQKKFIDNDKSKKDIIKEIELKQKDL